MAELKYLSEEVAGAIACGQREPWQSVIPPRDPVAMADILQQLRQGNMPVAFFEAAEELEERDPHYRAVLGARKGAVEGLTLAVDAEDGVAEKVLEAVQREIVQHPQMPDLLSHLLDALAKGFSVVEIIWELGAKLWRPEKLHFCPQNFFVYDRCDGVTLKLRSATGMEEQPLSPYKFIVHEAQLKSGLPVRSGLALPALWYSLIKSYNLSSWASFVDRFGYPLRIAKYGKKASDEDVETLKRAVRQLGQDIGAVIPDSMAIEIVQAANLGAGAKVYEDLARWVDQQLSKLVLGQTMTTESGGSLAQARVHDGVRRDIIRADARQLVQTLNRDLLRPFVLLNFGKVTMPRLLMKESKKEDKKELREAVKMAYEMGLPLSVADLRQRLELPVPKDQQDVLVKPAPLAANVALNQQNPSSSAVVATADVLWETVQSAAKTDSYEGFVARLENAWPNDDVSEELALELFKARVDGAASVEDDE